MRGVRPARAVLPALITSVTLLSVADIFMTWRVRRGAVGMNPITACKQTIRTAREKKTFILTGKLVRGACFVREMENG